MKIKSISLILFLFSYAFTIGQTITSSAIPNIGDKITNLSYSSSSGLNPQSINIGNAGANQVWDFSNPDVPDGTMPVGLSVSYSNLDDFTYRSEFPDANMGIKTDNGESYILRTNNEIRSLGFAGPDGTISTIEGDYITFKTPFSFNESFTTNYSTNIYVAAIDSTLSTPNQIVYTFDATGTVHTPAGTFNDCNRIFSKQTTTSNGYEFVSYTYSWYAKNSYESIATVSTDENGETLFFSWGSDVVLSSLNETELSNCQLQYLKNGMFQLTSDISMDTEIRLIDLMGRDIERLDYSIIEGENQLQLAMDHLAAGTYVLIVKDTKTNNSQSLKFIK